MAPHMQNPGLAPRVSRIQVGSWLHPFTTASSMRAQMLAGRFCLSPWMAQDVARLCFGEGRND